MGAPDPGARPEKSGLARSSKLRFPARDYPEVFRVQKRPNMITTNNAIEAVQEFAHPLTGNRRDFDRLLRHTGQCSFVLLGEASHGTHEFYHARAEITRRLITEYEFNLVCWEADWPDALRVHRYIRGAGSDESAEAALRGFKRFPSWMWRNTDIVQLVAWLREHNESLPDSATPVAVHGLDLYSLHTSMHEVIRYLNKADPTAAAEARQRYSCFEDYGDDPQQYGLVSGLQQMGNCEKEVIQQLLELQRRTAAEAHLDGRAGSDELFYAEQNARVAANAEHYYRAMYRGRPNTWNLRDTHMANTLDDLFAHYEKHGDKPKAIVWAHNSHLGDSRATQMAERGELNLGQLIRERHDGDCWNVGFTTHTGTVMAADDWDRPAKIKKVRPSLPDSFENLFHETGHQNFLLNIRPNADLSRGLDSPMLERAIGVIYRPETERYSHYFEAHLARQFDSIIHFDETTAVTALEAVSEHDETEMPETYPSGV
jgi:erythromycin esterase-like protein